MKAAAKRSTMKNSLPAIKKLEKEFLGTPNKLAAQLNKEISSLKQKESAMKKAISKLNADMKKSEQRVLAAKKMKAGTQQKKQLNSAKLNQKKSNKAQNVVEKQLNALTSSIKALMSQQSKMSSLKKHLAQFQKDWKAQAKLATDAKPSKQVKLVKVKAKATKKAPKAMKPNQQSSAELFDINQLTHEEAAEATS